MDRPLDLNLTDLISSVERDILLLEQMETKSTKNPEANDLPFPFSKEVFKLQKIGKDHTKSFQTTSNKPPAFPPKRSQDSDLQRICDSVSKRNTLRGSVSVPPNNVLYSRRLPSPPVCRKPQIPNEVANNFTQDDHFQEKPGPECSDARQLYCLLCAQQFGYTFGLECHLLSVHRDDLKELATQQDLVIEKCPKCSAQFVSDTVLVKHLIATHTEFIVKSLLFDEGFLSAKKYLECRFCGQHFMQRHLKLFTTHVERKHESELKRFICKDLTNIVSVESGENQNENTSTELALTISLLRTVTFQQVGQNNPKLKHKDQENSSQGHLSQTLASGLRKKRSSSQPSTRTLPRMPSSKGTGDFQISSEIPTHGLNTSSQPHFILKKLSTPAEIRRRPEAKIKHITEKPNVDQYNPIHRGFFLLPTYRHVPQPEPPPESPLMFGSEDEDKRTTTSSFVSTSSESSNDDLDIWSNAMLRMNDNIYKCNLCEMCFAENISLLTHLKNKHRSNVAKALKPQFSCGACPAKFFKNSFLVKHCEHHLNNERQRN